jgi:hypothetical protein
MTNTPAREGLPELLFDGYAVYQALTDRAKSFVSPEAVSEVLDAIVRTQRTYIASQPTPGGGEAADALMVLRSEETFLRIVHGDDTANEHMAAVETLAAALPHPQPVDYAHEESEARKDARLVGAGYTVDGVRICPTRIEIYTPPPPSDAAQGDSLYAMALRVREALDRQSCPDVFMRIAVEAIISETPPSQPVRVDEYRALRSGDTIQAGDEFLDDNCKDWRLASTAPIFVGMGYDPAVMKAVRRAHKGEGNG